MNRLRQLLDQDILWTSPTISDQQLDDANAWLQQQAPKAICFFCGHTDSVPAPKIDPVLLRVPYEVCWFEFERSERAVELVIGALVVQRDGYIRIDLYTRASNVWHWNFCSVITGDWLGAQSVKVLAHNNADDIWQVLIYHIGGFVSALNCTNVDRVENVPSPKLQAARQKRGKQPLFSYWTLHLTTKSASGEPLGGTHASPRVHLRRGHPRQYAPGKYTWVQPHAVGNKSLGIVHKDYDGSGLQGAPA